MDAYGYLQIRGRVKDLIIRGGENIYPAEIEKTLHAHPKVQEAQVSFQDASRRVHVELKAFSLSTPRWSEWRTPAWAKRSAPSSNWGTDRTALSKRSETTAGGR